MSTLTSNPPSFPFIGYYKQTFSLYPAFCYFPSSCRSPSSDLSFRPSGPYLQKSQSKEKAHVGISLTPISPRSSREITIVDPWFGSPTAAHAFSLSSSSIDPIPLTTLSPPSHSVGDEGYQSEDTWYSRSKNYFYCHSLDKENQDLEWLARKGSVD
ncbi:hypothetical protein NE237_022323 [Protea cynaroides]|uniref:Uncharacterized protein n=1 Tax=Protea cynaroides TaxID=273540 RepID=A0A9Q0HAT6_9MAGN|nr:hypothetical protein NE237_022323 [Protea cynaroides]